MIPQQRHLRSGWIRVLLLLLLIAGGWIGYTLLHHSEPPRPMTVPVGRGSVEKVVLATGTVETKNLVSVGAQVSGRLESLKVDLGDRVTPGQLVAEIDSLPQQNTLRTEEAALAVVEAQKQAKLASLHQAQLAFERQRLMLKNDAGSQEQFEAAEATLKVCEAEITALDAQIEQARLSVDTARLDLSYTRITSPIDGVVVAVVTTEGQTVNANQSAPTIIKVAQLDTMTIKVEISEADVVRVKPGQRVSFTILGEPDQIYETTLLSIEPAPESVASDDASSSSSSSSSAIYYIGVLDIPNPEGKLRIAMTAEVKIILDQVDHALVIPAAALEHREPDGRYGIRVVTSPDSLPERRLIRVGLNNNVEAAVTEGLQEGEQVVIGSGMSSPRVNTSKNSGRRRPMGPPPGMM